MIGPSSWPPGDSKAESLGEGGLVKQYHYPTIQTNVVITDGEGGYVRLSQEQFFALLNYARKHDLDREEGWK